MNRDITPYVLKRSPDHGTAPALSIDYAAALNAQQLAVVTAGGHSWSDYGQPSAIHELAALVTQLTAIQLPREPLPRYVQPALDRADRRRE